MPDVTASYGRPFDFIAFLGIFIHFWRPFMSELLVNFHRLCVWSIQTFWYVNMPDVTGGYGRFSDLIEIFFFCILLSMNLTFKYYFQYIFFFLDFDKTCPAMVSGQEWYSIFWNISQRRHKRRLSFPNNRQKCSGPREWGNL